MAQKQSMNEAFASQQQKHNAAIDEQLPTSTMSKFEKRFTSSSKQKVEYTQTMIRLDNRAREKIEELVRNSRHKTSVSSICNQIIMETLEIKD